MADHVITVRPNHAQLGIVLDCSCLELSRSFFAPAGRVPLTELNETAHEHIEAAEAVETKAWGDRTFRTT